MRLPIFLALFLSGTFAHAHPLEDINRQHSICFAHEYTNKDLNERPNQTVASIHADFSQQPDERDPTIYLNLKISAGGRHYDSFMICDKDTNGLKCVVECDGGGADVRPFNDGISFLNKGFLMSGGCGGESAEEPVVWLNPSDQGDDVFNLPAAPCE